MEKTYIQQLDDMHTMFGYEKLENNEVSLVAVLGIAGESGEVLEECIPSADHSNLPVDPSLELDNYYRRMNYDKDNMVVSAKVLDAMKKKSHSDPIFNRLSFAVEPERFDLELSDLFYYVLLAAKNRGYTAEDLARISVKKLQEKLKKHPR